MKKNGDYSLTLELKIEWNDQTFRYKLGKGVSVSRQITLYPEVKTSNAFNLPEISTKTFVDGSFVADISKGGSCNVDIYSYTPHNMTHVETSSHVLSNDDKNHPAYFTVADIDPSKFNAVTYLIDLQSLNHEPGTKIQVSDLLEKIDSLRHPVGAIALKTKSSEYPVHFDFTQKNFLSLDSETAKMLYNYTFQKNNSGTEKNGESDTLSNRRINALILDLPSIDSETDSSLLAHKEFFGILADEEKRQQNILVELAHFSSLPEGYYYCTMSPPRIQVNASLTDILFYPLLEEK